MQCQQILLLGQAGQLEPCHRIPVEYCQLLQRLEEHVACVNRLGLIRSMLCGDELPRTARLDVGFKYPVWIKQVGNNNGELAKKLAPFQIERATPSKKRGQTG